MIDVPADAKNNYLNYHGDIDNNTRFVVRDCKQIFEEEDHSSFGDIKRRNLSKKYFKGSRTR